MGAVFGGGSPAPPPAPPPPPSQEDPAVAEARRREIAANLATKGRRATLLTGADGATETANVQRKTLLGQ